MKFLFVLLLSLSTAIAHEKEMRTRADDYASGTFSSQKFHPWPFPLLSIGHNMQSYQDYGGSPYWHDGLDIRSLPDQPIYAAAGGKIINVENYRPGHELYWEIAILDDEGFVWKYHHVDHSSIPQEIRVGLRVESGTFLGNVVRWPSRSFGETFHHLHLLIVAKDGKYINPFLFMNPLEDSVAPVITKIGVAKNHRPLSGNQVSGEHSLYLEASDLVLHQKFILPPHKITYKIDGGEEQVMWEFVHLPSGTNDVDFIKDFYLDGTCGNYNCRKFYFNLNFTQKSPRKTMTLLPGAHSVEVTVEDMVGNKASDRFDWRVL